MGGWVAVLAWAGDTGTHGWLERGRPSSWEELLNFHPLYLSNQYVF